MTPAERAVRNSQKTGSLPTLTAPAAVSPAENQPQPLPLKLSLNIFGSAANSGNTHTEEATETHPEQLKQNESPATPLLATTAKPLTAQFPAPSVVSKPLVPLSDKNNAVPESETASPADESSATESSATEDTQTLLTQQPAAQITLPALAAAAAPAPTLAAPVPNNAFNVRAPKTERAQSQKSDPVQANVPAPVPMTLPTPASPAPIAIATPQTDANVAPAPSPKPEPAAVPNIVEPRPEQTHARLSIDAQVNPKPTAAPELAFALRVQQNAPAAPAAPVAVTPGPAPTPTAQMQTIGAQPVVSSAAEVRPDITESEPVQSTPKSAHAEPVVANAPAAQAQQTQSGNTSSDSGSKDDDSHRPASDVNVETAAPSVPAAQISQTVYTHAANAPVMPSAPAPASTQSSSTIAQAISTASTLATRAAETPKTGTANQISISVPAGDQQNVQVRLMDRAGEVHVTVRAPNEEMAGSLRQDLGSLTNKLNQSGFSTEAFTPSSGGGTLSRDQKTADPQQQNGDDRQTPERNQQQNSQQNPRGKRPAWLDEFENSLAG